MAFESLKKDEITFRMVSALRVADDIINCNVTETSVFRLDPPKSPAELDHSGQAVSPQKRINTGTSVPEGKRESRADLLRKSPRNPNGH